MKENIAFNYFYHLLKQGGFFWTDVKIQKMLFIAHIYSLVKYDEPLFKKPFQAKKQGPVIPFNKNARYQEIDDQNIGSKKEILDKVFDLFKDANEIGLVELINCLDSWKENEKHPNLVCNEKLRKEAVELNFLGLIGLL